MVENKKKVISIILAIVLIIGFVIYMIISNKSNDEINFDEIVFEQNNEENELTEKENIIEEKKKEIVVHITGEVKKEGVVYIQEGARVIDAVKKAGGETKNADLSQINLACVLQDGQKIYIPNKKEKVSEYISENFGNSVKEENSSNNKKEGKKVNINTAKLEELDQLPGIGPSTAQKIINYRNENGSFKTIEDIQEVKGIGDAKYNEIKDYITV